MKRLILICCVSTFFSFSNANGQTAITIAGLQSDHLENPVGIDNSTPRLSWRMEDDRQGARQTSYRILVGKDSAKVAGGSADMWDTGKVASGDIMVSYAGKQLQPFTKYYWKVIGGDLLEKEIVSPVNSFETGMMNIKNWQDFLLRCKLIYHSFILMWIGIR